MINFYTIYWGRGVSCSLTRSTGNKISSRSDLFNLFLFFFVWRNVHTNQHNVDIHTDSRARTDDCRKNISESCGNVPYTTAVIWVYNIFRSILRDLRSFIFFNTWIIAVNVLSLFFFFYILSFYNLHFFDFIAWNIASKLIIRYRFTRSGEF